MRCRHVLAVACACLAWSGAAAQDAALPDPDYCARRDADPRRCRIDDGVAPRAVLMVPEAAEALPAPPVPDASYCSRRDAAPAKCVIQDGPPPAPFIRRPGELAAPNFPAPGPDPGGITPAPPVADPASRPPVPVRRP